MNKKVLIINALDKESYNNCHIKGSVNFPLEMLRLYADKLDKNQEIIVYCARYECPVSKHAYKLLKQLGFTNVRAYEGGIIEWFKKGYPVEGSCTSDALKHSTNKQPPEEGVETITAEELIKKL